MSLRTSINDLSRDLSEFATSLESRLVQLKYSSAHPSTVNASTYKRCLNDLDSRVKKVDGELDRCEMVVNRSGATANALVHEAQVAYDAIERILHGSGVHSLEKGKETRVGTRATSDQPEPKQLDSSLTAEYPPQDSSPDSLTPSMKHLMGKYGDSGSSKYSRDAAYAKVPSPAFSDALLQQEVAMQEGDGLLQKYADDAYIEENTLELKSQVIFSRYNTNRGGGTEKPEPINELEDLPPAREEEKHSEKNLEQAISAALAKSSLSQGVTPSSAHQSSQMAAASAPRTVSTPSVPSAVPAFRPIDSSLYSTLPSFIKGQISLEDLASAGEALHAFVSRNQEQGHGVTFTADDVEKHTSLSPVKAKVLLNALAKLEQIKLKVIYGQGTVYFFM